jgi:hypothetical protein
MPQEPIPAPSCRPGPKKILNDLSFTRWNLRASRLHHQGRSNSHSRRPFEIILRCCLSLLCEGKEVKWVMRDGLSGPFSIYAPTFLGLWNIADHISTRFASSFSPCIMTTSGFCYDFFQRIIVGRILTNVYWRTANYLSVSHAEYWRTPNAEKLRPRPYSDG